MPVPEAPPTDLAGGLPTSVPVAAETPDRPSFRRNFAARFFADTYGLATSLVVTTITARVLGPSGRGYYASLTLLSVFLAQLFDAGLGEAAVVLSGRGRTDHRTAVSATVAVTLPLGVIGAVSFLLVGTVTLHVTTSNDELALILGAVLVLLNAWGNTLAWLLASRERLVTVAVVTVVSATVMMVSLYVLVAVARLGTAGAVLASVVGIAGSVVALTQILPREGISLRPSWNGSYLRAAARFGIAVQLSNLLVQMAGRLDLLFVYRIAGSSAAGLYSIALTIGILVSSIPMAIAYALFPRLPKLEKDEAEALTARLFRMGILAAITCAIGFLVVTPMILPLMFGPAYRGAIVPTFFLIAGGIPWSAQWLLCRAAAAREMPQPLFASFASSFAIMVVLDLVLIDPFGVVGAALASLTASVVGFLVAAVYCFREGWSWRPFVPRVADISQLVATVRETARGLRNHGPLKVQPDELMSPSGPPEQR
jgi:O-antigen/teichoic acid export membrane protein